MLIIRRGSILCLRSTFADNQAVNHHLDSMFFLFIQVNFIAQVINFAIHAHAHIARTAHILKDIFILALASLHKWSKQHNARIFRESEHRIDNLLDGLLAYLAPAFRAVGMADTRVQQSHIIINLGHGPNRRARIMRGSLLVNGDGGRESVDMVDIRLLHFIEELACIGRERLDIAALSFREDGVESQAALARTREAGDHHQPVARYGYINIFEIMFASTTNYNFVLRHTVEPPIPQIGSPQVELMKQNILRYPVGCLHHSPNAAAFTIPRMRLPSPFPECGYQFVDTNVRYRFLSYNNMSRVVGARFIATHGW